MQKLLILTSIQDKNIPLYLTDAIQKKAEFDFYFFHEDAHILEGKLLSKTYDALYIGYHFRDLSKPAFNSLFSLVQKYKKNAYIIDNLQSLHDVYFEDKWYQYEMFSEFMPQTKKLTQLHDFSLGKHLIKERVSGKAEGIFFNTEAINSSHLENYIMQERISIQKEYRVYVVFGYILPDVTLRQPKTEHSKVKIIDKEKISSNLESFVGKILKKNPFDLIGIDIAEDSSGKLFLIEINRTCLFSAYFQQTKLNVAETLIDKLSKKLS